MKITVVEEPGAEKEIIIRCAEADAEISAVLGLLASREKKLIANDQGMSRLLDPSQVLYCESVDNRVFFYTAQEVLPASASLSEIAADFASCGFIRCSKSLVVNVHCIEALKSYSSGRIIATICNGERIVISRHYAKLLRQMLLK